MKQGGVTFGIKKFADKLEELYKEKEITVTLNSNLISIDKDKNIAMFKDTKSGHESCI